MDSWNECIIVLDEVAEAGDWHLWLTAEPRFDLTSVKLSKYSLESMMDESDELVWKFVAKGKEENSESLKTERLYRLGDVLMNRIEATIGREDEFIRKWSLHKGNQPFGKFSEEERPRRTEECVRQAQLNYGHLLPALQKMVSECRRTCKKLYLIEEHVELISKP
jgi:hypothetical protein